MEALLTTWDINARVSVYLLDALDDAQLTVKPVKAKAVDAQFVHIAKVRVMWLKASAPDLIPVDVELDGSPNRAQIRAALDSTAAAIRELIARAGSAEGRIKGFKPHATAFVGYLISHESNHRAHIELGLRQAGAPIDDKTSYGLWEWGVR